MTTEPLSVSPEWSALHLRVARGETLNDQERAAYEAVLKRLDETEIYPATLEELRRTRAHLADLEKMNAELTARSDALRAEITRLEALLDARSRQTLASAGGETR
jgi:cell division protein FtsB